VRTLGRSAVGLALVLCLGPDPAPAATGIQEPPQDALTREDSVASVALARLAAGFPLSAARDLAAALSTAVSDPSPELVLLAARAHAEAAAWSAVTRLLTDRPWLDTLAAGEGRLLLATAALAKGRTAEAAAHFERIVPMAGRLEATVGYARALEGEQRDTETAAAYLAAADLSPGIGDWLRLSALQALARAAKVDMAIDVATALADSRAVRRDSVWLEVATAAFRAGEPDRGLAYADSLSRAARASLAGEWVVPALLAAGDTAAALRVATRAVAARATEPETGELLIALDPGWETLRRVAASDVRQGRADRAAQLLSRASAKAPGRERAELDMQRAKALFAARHYRSVGSVLEPWLADPAAVGSGPEEDDGAPVVSDLLLAEMRFLAGRALYRRGLQDSAIVLWDVVAAQSGAPDGPYASWLIADTHHQRGDLERAEEVYESTAARFPRSTYGGQAHIRLGMLSLLREEPSEAVRHFDDYRRRFPGGGWFHAATYWAARARDAAGDSAEARVLHRQALGQDPLSYYGIQASRALGLEAWDHLTLRSTPPPPDLSSAHRELLEQMNRLRAFGWKRRALRELSARDRQGETWRVRLGLARALNQAGWTWQGTALGWQVLRSRSGLWSEDLLRVVYPLIYGPVLEEVAARERVDPALMAALVRRESQFDRDVISSAAAVGLMQVLPRTGAEVARQVGIADFDANQLVVPEVNLVLGGRYLRDLLSRYGGSLVPALISYNAGPHRYARWRSYPEFSADAELMIERIPFTETRLYVKALITYRYVYGRLYDLGAGGRASSAELGARR
jgi:soluble lytic murein transglycosylase